MTETDTEYKAFLIIRELETGNEVHRIGLRHTDHHYVERVLKGALINLGDDYYIDDSEAYAEDDDG